jgi:hypothetical protein
MAVRISLADGKRPAVPLEKMRAPSRRTSNTPRMDRSVGDDRIGVAAPPFQFDAWLNSEPLSLRTSRDESC